MNFYVNDTLRLCDYDENISWMIITQTAISHVFIL